jgi:putative transposase
MPFSVSRGNTGGVQAVQWSLPAPLILLSRSAAKRLKALEDENVKLKKLLAEAMLDNAMLKEIAAKKW